MGSRKRVLALLTFLALCALPAFAGADQVLITARKHLEAKDAKAAYQLLVPLQAQRAGDPLYDYLLGVAAINLDKYTEAVFALERVLALQPNNLDARTQIARAHFALKETDAARREFQTVQQQYVSPEVRHTIERYLDAIDRGASRRMRANFYLEFAGGWDSNVNAATAIDQVAIPLFGNSIALLSPASTEQADGFVSGGGGLNLTNPLSRRFELVAGLAAFKRFNFHQSDFATGYLSGHLGLAARLRRSTLSVVGQANLFFLDDPAYSAEYRSAVGGTAQWTYDLDARNQFTAYVQYAALAYPDQAPRDADRWIVGGGYAHAFRGGDPIVYVGVYGGIEKERDAQFDYLAHRPLGLRLGGQKQLRDRWLIFANAAFERRDYRGIDPLFQRARVDDQYSFGLGLTYTTGNDWKISPQITYLLNKSNIPISEYDRLQIFVTLRKDF